MKAEQAIQKANVSFMSHPAFRGVAGVVLFGKSEIVDDPKVMPTAATDGVNKYYGRGFIDAEDHAARTMVVGHETMHQLLRHTFVYKELFKKDPQCANIAADFVVNLMLYDGHMSLDAAQQGITPMLPPLTVQPLMDERLRGWSTDRIFRLIQDLADKKAQIPGGTTVKEWGGRPVKTLDDIKFSRGKKGGGSGVEGADSMDDHMPDSGEAMTEEQAKELESIIRTGKMMAGRDASGALRHINMGESKISWEELLENWVQRLFHGGHDETWTRPNRRFAAHNIYLPSGRTEVLPPLLLAIDTSGSISNEVLATVKSHIQKMVERYAIQQVDVLYWDSRVAGFEQYPRSEVKGLVDSTKPKGGGGTDPCCIRPYVLGNALKYFAAIVFTDGCFGDEGNWDFVNHRVIWVVDGPERVFNAGRSVQV